MEQRLYLTHDELKEMLDNPVDVDSSINEMYSNARTFAVFASTMISYMMFKCKFVFTNKPDLIPTAGAVVTEYGNVVLLDINFFSKLGSDKQRAYLIFHEVLHIFLEHGDRLLENDYDPRLWSAATDFRVNSTCSGLYSQKTTNYHGRESYSVSRASRMEKFLEFPMINGKSIGIQPKDEYVRMSAEEIYEALQEQQNQTGGGSGEGEGDSGDEPMDIVYRPMAGSEEAQQKIKEQVMKNRQSAIAAANMAKQSSDGIGSHELDLVNQIREVLKPKVNWPDDLRSKVTSKIPMRMTYNRFSRRSCGGVIFPVYEGDHLNVTVGVDSSGSMTRAEFIRCYSELIGLLNDLDSWTLTLLTCDVKPHVIGQYNSEEYTEPDDIVFDMKGGGGTDMKPLLDFSKEQYTEDSESIDLCVIMTDGDIPMNLEMGYEDFHCILMSTSNRNISLPDDIDVVHVEI